MPVVQSLAALFKSSGNVLIDWTLAVVLVVAGVCAATYAVTSLQFYLGSLNDANGLKEKRKPLTVPYWIPYLGSALSMIDMHGLNSTLARKSQASRPLRVKVGPKDIYLVFGPENMRQLFQNSRQLAMKARVSSLFAVNNVPPADLHLIKSDCSGEGPTPLYDIAPEKRIWRNAIELFATHLSAGPAVNELTNKFREEFVKQLRTFSDEQFVSITLYKFLQKYMLIASALAFTGEELFTQNPDWHEVLWEYDAAFLLLNLDLPRWLVPGVHAARDKMKASVVKWFEAAHFKDDLKTSGDPSWEPVWGSRFWRVLVRNFLDLGTSLEGAAAGSLTTMWATHSNAIPATVWMLFEILSRPSLHADITTELSTSLTSSSPPTFDLDKLLALPLLNSVYKEVLRIRTSTIMYREAMTDVSIGDTILPKGAVIMASSWPAHTNPHNWASYPIPPSISATTKRGSATSTRSSTLSPMEFDPWRILAVERIKHDHNATKADKDRAAAALSPNNFFPWGGGSHMCAGRYFAKQEILIAVATLLAGFDIKVVGWEKPRKGWEEDSNGGHPISQQSERPAEPDISYAGSGVLPPDRDLRVKFKRKAW